MVQAATPLSAIVIDAKDVRGTQNGSGTRVHLMLANDHGTGAVLGQASVPEKSNEIPYFSTLLDGTTDLAGVVVSAEALHTQAGIPTTFLAGAPSYVLMVKGNQPGLRKQCADLPWKRVRTGNRTVETANGRIIERTAKCVSIAKSISFSHEDQVAQIRRMSRPLGTLKWHTETVYIVTSLTPSQGKPADIGALIRGH